jgi:hypothetical protein
VAILFGQAPSTDTMARMGNIRFPVSGQIAVVIYVTVGDAKPTLEFQGIETTKVNGRKLPVAKFKNTGNAHGRPDGLLEGKDANANTVMFLVSPSPILPGRSRVVPVWPQDPNDSKKMVDFAFPVSLKGTVEWEGGNVEVSATAQ